MEMVAKSRELGWEVKRRRKKGVNSFGVGEDGVWK